MSNYDVVIVGSGLGGLACGCILSKEGLNVCVVEKHFQIGGCLQTFKRDNCVFDTGMHYIGSMDDGQVLNQLFKYFNVMDKLKLKKLDDGCFDRINFHADSKDYDYAIGYDRFKETMLGYFPEESAALDKYISKIKEITSSLKPYNLREIDSAMNMINSEYLMQSASGFIDSCTDNIMLRNILGGTNPLYAGERNVSPIYIHAVINNHFIESAYRFVDGGDQLASLLAGEIRNNGGTVLTKKKVVEFISSPEGISGIKTADGDVIEGKHFISNIHPAETLKMTDSSFIKNAYRIRVSSAPNTPSTFCLYASFKQNSFKYMNHNYYCYGTDDIWSGMNYNDKTWPKGYMLLTPASSKSEVWADCGIIMTYMSYDDVKKWDDSYVEKRGDEYRDFKKEKAEKLLDSVEERFPGFRSKINNYYTSSPLTYRDYTGTYRGSIYGVMKDCNNPLASYIPTKTKIPNLYMTGKNISIHGVLGVTICSLLTCGEILGFNNIIRKVRNA